jgi:hypothetical protein
MKKNKYIIFAAIGFELISLILLAIYGGEWIVKNGWAPEYIKAFLIVAAFILWFISLMVKLKKAEKND